MNGEVTGSDAKIFTFKCFAEKNYMWTAPSLQKLLEEKEEEVKKNDHLDISKISHADFAWCYLRSMERAWIFCHAALIKGSDTPGEPVMLGGDLSINYNANGKHTLQLNEIQSPEISRLDSIGKHHFDVVAKVLEEIYWHFYSNQISNLCTNIFPNEAHSSGLYSHHSGEENCSSWLNIKSADFVRQKIRSISQVVDCSEIKNHCDWKNEFGSSFGWSADKVQWGVDDADKNSVPSFLRFRAFTDNPDVRVFLVKNIADGCIYEPVYSDDSGKLMESVKIFLQDKIAQCLDDFVPLSVCCGVRFSHKNIGDGHTPCEDDELLGVFVTLNVKGVDLAALETISDSIHAASGSIKYILLQNLAREKAIEQHKIQQMLETQNRENQKYVEMFSLLTDPLGSLTEALAKTQADTQQLRAILYDPWEAIFRCQPMIAELFTPRGQLHIADTDIPVMHQPSSLEPKHAQLVFAKALASFKGKDLEWKATDCPEDILSRQLSGYKNDGNETGPHRELSKALKKIFGIDTWNEINVHTSGSYLNKLKERFYTAYKPGEASKTLGWPVLNAFLPNDVHLKKLLINDQPTNDSIFPVIAKAANSLAMHGHLIEFIAGIVWKHIDDLKKQKGVGSNVQVILNSVVKCPVGKDPDLGCSPIVEEADYCEAVFESPEKWVKEVAKLQKLLSVQKKYRKKKVRFVGEYGDFHKPFVKLVQRIPDNMIKTFRPNIGTDTELSIDLGTLQIKFIEHKFVICSYSQNSQGVKD